MEFVQYLQKLLKQVEGHMVEMTGKEHYCVQPFIIARNSIGIVGEVFDMYTKGQSGLQGPLLTKGEITFRLKCIIRDLLFIQLMSTFEYYTIKLAQIKPDSRACLEIKTKGERNIHLSNLIPLIPELEQEKRLWDFAIALRNDLVHFAGYARKTLPSPVPDFPIHMIEGQESKGNLRSFLSLLCYLEESFFKFVKSVCCNP
jgi:hypothetical protein